MAKSPKTYNLEAATIEAIERLASDTRRHPGAIVDLAVEYFDKLLARQQQHMSSQLDEAMQRAGCAELPLA